MPLVSAPDVPPSVTTAQASLRTLAERSAGAKAAERANAQSYPIELAEAHHAPRESE